MNRVTVSSYPTRVTLHCGQNKVTLRYTQKGERGIGISNVALDDKAHLIVTYDDGKTQDAGAALGDVASVKDGIDSSYKKVQASEANVTKLEASTKANADKAQQALQDTQSASTSGVDTINTLVSEKMTYMTSTFNSLLTQAKANIDQLERDAEDKIHRVRTYSLEQIKTAHDDAMVDIERSVNKAEAWAVSETTPDREPDFESPTGLTQSSRSWALLSKKKLQEAFDTLKDIKDSETNAKVSETQASTYAGNSKASADAAKLSEMNAASSASSASDSEAEAATQASNASKSATAASSSASAAKTSETNSASSASSASTSASNAKASETNAKTSETNAAESQQSATSSATIANNWAIATTSPDGATDVDSNTGKTQSSRSWALASKASAESASSSASTATTQASSATASADSASESATSASNSATSASSLATAASNSASAAATSATNASNSEKQASGYKTSASDSATAAASSATSASTSATNAKASMNTANTAASSANTSATNASTSASNAAKAEVSAKTAQAAAEKARDDANSAVNKLTGAMKYAGQVDNYSDLADVTKNKGDVWNIVNADSAHGIKAGDNVAWNGTDWDNLSGTVDLSIYAEKADYQKVITSATADGATITFNHKDGTTSTTMVNNVASATAATNDAKGQKIDATYEKVTDASNVHTSLQNSINSLSTSKQDKLTFDLTPTEDSSNPVTSSGIKTALDGKPSNTGAGASGTWPISVSGNASTATKATQDAAGNVITTTYATKLELNSKQDKLTFDSSPTADSENPVTSDGIKTAIDTAIFSSQADWNVTDSTKGSYIKNKPDIYTVKTFVSSDNQGYHKYLLLYDITNFTSGNLYATGFQGVITLTRMGGYQSQNLTGLLDVSIQYHGTLSEYTGEDVLHLNSSNPYDVLPVVLKNKDKYYLALRLSYSAYYLRFNGYWSGGTPLLTEVLFTSNTPPDGYEEIKTGQALPFYASNAQFSDTATKLSTARTIQTNLASTSSASFDGTANVAPGVTGILPVANGGTGVSSLADITVGNATADASGNNIANTYATKAELNNKQDKLSFDSTPTADSTNPVTSGGIKTALDGKPSNTGAGASGTWNIGISGNAATATKAEQDASGNNIVNTYAKKTDTYTKTEVDNKVNTLKSSIFNSDNHLVFPSGAEMWVE